eukprot:753488-Prymnesium_polylepis.1
MNVLSSTAYAVQRGALLAESTLEQIRRVAENDFKMQSLTLSGSAAFQVKAEPLVDALTAALQRNTSLTLLDLRECALTDAALNTLVGALQGNSSL